MQRINHTIVEDLITLQRDILSLYEYEDILDFAKHNVFGLKFIREMESEGMFDANYKSLAVTICKGANGESALVTNCVEWYGDEES